MGTECNSALSIRENSVYIRAIGGLADYGENLGKTRHPLSEPIEQFQKEVLMEEGYFKQMSEPIPFTGSDGTRWYYIDFEELGKPLN